MDDIRTIIQKLAGTFGKDTAMVICAKVNSVDVKKRTCNVTPLNSDFQAFTAFLMSEVDDGFYLVPAVESTVHIMLAQHAKPLVFQWSKIQECRIIAGDQTYIMKDGQQIFNDGSYGGIPIVKDPSDSNAGLLKRLNLLEQDINDLKSKLTSIVTDATTLQGVLTGWAASPSTPLVQGTAASALSPFIASIISQLTPYNADTLVETTETQISNPNIVHGKDDPAP